MDDGKEKPNSTPLDLRYRGEAAAPERLPRHDAALTSSFSIMAARGDVLPAAIYGISTTNTTTVRTNNGDVVMDNKRDFGMALSPEVTFMAGSRPATPALRGQVEDWYVNIAWTPAHLGAGVFAGPVLGDVARTSSRAGDKPFERQGISMGVLFETKGEGIGGFAKVEQAPDGPRVHVGIKAPFR